jgi:hypothetical protein
VTPVTPCFGSETDTVSQAASPVNEANSTAGWYTCGPLDSFTSESSGCADGSYCPKAVQSTVLGGVAGFSMDLGSAPFSLISGHKYFISYNLKHTGVGSQSWSCGFADTPSGIDNEPFNQVFSGRTNYLPAGLQLDYTGATRYFTCQEQAPGYQDGSGIYLDGFSVKEIISSANEICGDDTTPPAAPSGLTVQ